MRARGAIAATVAAGLAAALGAPGPNPAGAHTSARPPARMMLYAQEWSLYSSRAKVPSGTVIVQLWNRGQDAHDVKIRHVRRGHMFGRPQSLRKTGSGAITEATWRLKPGTYELYCSLPKHLGYGMHTTIVVR